MRTIRNTKNVSGFTYTKPAIDLFAAISEAPEPRLPAVTHVDVHPTAVIDKHVIDWAKATTPGAVPVFHRWHRQVEFPSCLGPGLDLLAS